MMGGMGSSDALWTQFGLICVFCQEWILFICTSPCSGSTATFGVREIVDSEYYGAALEEVALEHIMEMGIKDIDVANEVFTAVLKLREELQEEGAGQEGGTAAAGIV